MESSPERLDSLKAELESCDAWDAEYLRHSHHDIPEVIAFVNRKNRRAELTAEIAALSNQEGLR